MLAVSWSKLTIRGCSHTGVAIITASTSLERTSWKSLYAFASVAPIFARAFSMCWSTTSQIAVILTRGSFAMIDPVYVPRLPAPMRPILIVLLCALPRTAWKGTIAAV